MLVSALHTRPLRNADGILVDNGFGFGDNMPPNSRSGGTGRRAGFKIPSWQQGEGSTPSFGISTKNYQNLCLQAEFFLEVTAGNMV